MKSLHMANAQWVTHNWNYTTKGLETKNCMQVCKGLGNKLVCVVDSRQFAARVL